MTYGVRFTPRTGSTPWPGAAVGTSTRATSDTKSGRVVHGGEAGFTLVEALVAIVVLIFGLMAVTNLMLVAASSNSVANQGTAAVTSAIRVMDMIKANRFTDVANAAGGGEFDAADTASAKLCSDTSLGLNEYHCNDEVPGVGSIHTHWFIESVDARLVYVRVHSEGRGALSAARSRAEFTTFRACTNSDAASGGQCQPAS